MNKFDNYLRKKAAQEQREIPDLAKEKIDKTILNLPERIFYQKPFGMIKKIAVAFACFVFITIFVFPNISVSYAQALEKIPIIGDIVKVVTIRNYFYSDDNHEMDIDVPKLEGEQSGLYAPINDDIEKLTNSLMNKFYEDLELIGTEGHSSVYADYEMVTNTDKWFTLKICVYEIAGIGNIYYKYYHLDKLNQKAVQLSDIVSDNKFYDIVKDEIEKQMIEAMKKDANLVYWIKDNIYGNDIVIIDEKHNFYWDKDGNLVIPFDKYEVAPGYMGTPEFTIDKNIIKDNLKKEFTSVIKE